MSSNIDRSWQLDSNDAVRGAPAARPRAMVSRWLALQDLVLLGYLVTMRVLLARAPASAMQAAGAHAVDASLAVLCAGVAVARVVPGVPALARALLYRLALVVVLAASYGSLKNVLPVVRPDAVDGSLFAIDRALFGGTPSLWLERFNHPSCVEWFAFFYFSYYAICLGYMVLFTFVLPDGRREGAHGSRIGAFALGTLGLYMIGQLGYVAVPAFGPCVALRDRFHGPIHGGLFWGLVWHTVQAGSVVKDVFPSMHTCGPWWFTAFAIGLSRRERRFWPLAIATGFFAANIVVATMLLRWHYLIDVVVGFSMAMTAGVFVPRIVALEEARRERLGLAPVWPRCDAWWWGRGRKAAVDASA